MLTSPTKKNRVDLADYDHDRDIKNRILMSQFTLFEADILEEILSSSLKFTTASLAATMDVEVEELFPMLEKLTSAQLLTYDKKNVIVNKEMRKFYEFQFQKFDNDFKPSMDFIQQLLKKVPIEVLPTWYFIPRTSDNIFESLIEKYFTTPQAYEKYLEELNFEDPILSGIMEDVFESEDFKVRSRYLREKYGLTRAEFEEYMLHLEFNFVCFLSYNRIEEEDGWKEVVTPFHEWKEYLFFQRKQLEKTRIENHDAVDPIRPLGFSFVIDAKSVLSLAKETPIQLIQSEGDIITPTLESLKSILNEQKITADKAHLEDLQDYFAYVLSKLNQFSLLNIEEHQAKSTSEGLAWCDLPNEDFALNIHRHSANQSFIQYDVPQDYCINRNFRAVEKALQDLEANVWWDFEAFVKRMVAPIGESDPVMLKKKGRSWTYVIPEYNEEEMSFIEACITERLYETGMVNWGTHQDEKICFSLTTFGKHILGIE